MNSMGLNKNELDTDAVIRDLREQLRQRDAKIKSLTTPWWKKAKRNILKLIFKTPHQLGVLRQYEPRPLIFNQSVPDKTKNQLPGFCILTPSYNQGAFLERTILSVLNQNYPNLRYGVQDGGSSDNSLDIIKKYSSSLQYSDSRTDNGQAAAINYGFVQMKPRSDEIMAWLNSDDVLLPGALQNVATYFSNNPSVDVIYGHRIIIDENDLEVGRWYLPAHRAESIKWIDFVPQETLFWRASAWHKTTGIDENFQFALDWSFLLNLEGLGCKIKRLPEFLGCFRLHAKQKTSLCIQMTGAKEMHLLRPTHGVSTIEVEKHIRNAAVIESRKSALCYQLSRLDINL